MGAEASKLQPEPAPRSNTSSPRASPPPTESAFKLVQQASSFPSSSSPSSSSSSSSSSSASVPSPRPSHEMPPPPVPLHRQRKPSASASAPMPPRRRSQSQSQYMVALSGWPQPVYAGAPVTPHPYARQQSAYAPFAEPPCIPLEAAAAAAAAVAVEKAKTGGVGPMRRRDSKQRLTSR